MENLQKSLVTIRKENEERKTAIMTCLEDLVKNSTPDKDLPNNSLQMLNVFEYEKKLHEKLTEIQFNLHKFTVLNETSGTQQTIVANPDPNISMLISNTSRLLTQLGQISSCSYSSTQNTENTFEHSIKKLSDHSKDVLKNLSSTPEAPKPVEHKDIENLNNPSDYCGHYPEIHEAHPQISRSCSSNTLDVAPTLNDDACVHFPKLSPIWPELNTICQDVSGKQQTSEEVELEDIAELEFCIPNVIKSDKLLCVDESTSSETEDSLFELETKHEPKDLSFTKLNNGENVKEDTTSSEAESTVDVEKPEVYSKVFGVPTSVLRHEHNKNFSRVQNNLLDDFEMLGIDELTPEKTQSLVKDCNLNANFSAEEKIKKLGVIDRREAFEQSRTIAAVPDLRLLPSESTKHPNPTHYVIKDAKIPKLNVKCTVSFAESPSEFYIHLDNHETALLDDLNNEITSQFKNTKAPYKTKLDAFESIGNFCCAYLKNYGSYYRAQIGDWFFDKPDSKLIMVQLVDYGNKVLVHLKHLRNLTKEFACLPKTAIKCYLPMLYPPGSSRSSLLQNWPPASIEEFKELSGSNADDNKPIYRIAYIEEKGDKTAVDLFVEDRKDPVTIGQLLVDLGHAVQIILPDDDPMGVISDEEDIQKLEECNNINEVVLGYDPKDEGRVCKFTRKDGTCFKGKNCTLEHVELTRGGYTNDKILTYVGALNKIVLPREGDHVYIRFTAFLDAAHYYVNLTTFVDSLTHLENIINDKSNIATLKTYKITPAFGEIVLVEHWTKRWLRAKIKHHLYNNEGHCTEVQVFMVDYGDVIDVPISKIRHIKPEYLEVAFQAIECVLYNYKMQNAANMRLADKFFYENMYYRNFIARIMAVPDTLCIRVFHKNNDLGEILCNQGFLTKINRQVPSDKILAVPSG